MEILLSTLIVLLILGACLYQRTSLFTSLAALTFTMLALSLFGPVGFSVGRSIWRPSSCSVYHPFANR